MKRLLLTIAFLLWALPAFAQTHTFQTDDQTWQSWLACINELAPCSTVSHGGGGGSTPGGANNSVQINSNGALAGVACAVNEVFYGQIGAPVCSGAIVLTSVIASVNNELNVMAPPYNAKGDGATDDTAAIQQAIWDSTTGGVPFGSCTSSVHKSVYLPTPSVCYAHSAPLRVTCPNFELFGNQGSALCNLNYIGDALIQESATSPIGLSYGSSLVAGPGNSLSSASGQFPVIDLAHFLNNTKSGSGLNTAFSSGFNIAFFIKETTDGYILESAPAYPGTGNGAFTFSYGAGNHQITAYVNTVTGGRLTVGTCAAQTPGIVYEIELDWDGSTYRLWQGVPGGTAVSCGTQSSSNPMIVGPFEDMSLPANGPHEFWPDGSSVSGPGAFVGNIDSIRFEAQSVHTSAYIVPPTKFSDPIVSNYDVLVLNFESSLNGTQFGTTGYGGAVGEVYFPIWGAGIIGSNVNNYIHDLDLCGGGGSGFNNLEEGLFAIGANSSFWDNLSCSNNTYTCADFASNDYVSQVNNLNCVGGRIGPNHGAAWNDSWEHGLRVAGTMQACEAYQGGGGGQHHDSHTYCADNTDSNYYGVIENMSSGLYDDFYEDQEGSNANWRATFLLNQPAFPYQFNFGFMFPGNTGAYIEQDNGGAGSTIITTNFQAFGSPPEIIEFTTNGSPVSPTAPASPFYLEDVALPSGVALSNLPQWVIQRGVTPTYKVTIASSTQLIPTVVADSKFIITLNSNGATPSTPILLPPGLAQAGPNYKSQFLKAYVCYNGSRSVSDGVTNSTTTITSATAAFVTGDRGRVVTGSSDIPAGDYIASITNGTTAILHVGATGSDTAQTFTLNNFIPGWTNGVGSSLHGSLPTSSATGAVCDVYNWDYRDPTNIFLDSYTLALPE